jgi:hypothetical protein
MPAPRGAGKAAAVIVAVAVLLIIMIFVGLNLQHAKELGEQKSGQVQPQNLAGASPHQSLRCDDPGSFPGCFVRHVQIVIRVGCRMPMLRMGFGAEPA